MLTICSPGGYIHRWVASTNLRRPHNANRSVPVIGGVKDTQVPIADADLLIHSGSEPREAWINPAGGHMGREAKGWTDQSSSATSCG
jgi:hypothetical protein